MSTCVGRERELAWLLSKLEATGAHGTGLALVTGPSGVGKSRLASELREQARVAGFPVLEGWCVAGAAFAPFVSIASQALAWLRARGERESLSPGDLEALAPLVSSRAPRHVDQDDGEGPMRFVEAVGRLLAAVGRVRPVLVLVRGYSRADEATRTLLRSLLDAAGPVGEPTPGAPAALLVVTVRSGSAIEFVEHPRVAQLALEGLDRDGVRKILGDERFVMRVHAVTGGNPDALWGMLERPPTSRATEVLSRVEQLGDTARALLAALGVASRPLPVAVLAQAVGGELQTASRAVRALVDGGLVWRDLDASVGDVVLGLVHADDAAGVVGRMQPDELAALHQKLGDALADWGRAPSEEVLRHLLAGAEPAKYAPRAVEVAASLLARHAPAAALSTLIEASRHADAATLAQLAPLASAAAKQAGGHGEARALVVRAIERNPALGELSCIEAELALGEGDLDACGAALEKALEKSREDERDLRARISATRAELCYQRGLLDEAEGAAREAIAHAREDDPIHTQARTALTKVFMWRGELEKAWDWTQENIARARARGATTEVLRGVINLGVIAVRRGDLDEASRLYDAASAIAARGGTMMLRGVLRENEAVVAHLRGRFGDALTLYQEALGILIRVGHRQFLARVANNLGELYVQVGETARARRLCDYAAQVGRGLSRGVTAEGLLLRAQVELLEARTDAARVVLSEALALFTAAGETSREAEAHLLLARAYLTDGDTAGAARALAMVPEAEETLGVRLLAERQRLLAELDRAEGRDALNAARRSLELAERARDEDLRLRAHVQLGLAWLDRGDALAARRNAEAAEALRAELVSRVSEGLRPSYEATIARAGLSQLAARVEVATTSALAPGASSRARAGIHAVEGAGSVPPGDRSGLVGESPAMVRVRRMIARVAPADTTVLLLGESGTGKERVAEAIHRASRRKNGPLVAVNCGALAEGVLLSELFGHERGAFTGAAGRRKGRFEQADGGTIFLDEIGEVSPAMQAALLRVLQERTFERVGGNVAVRVDVRVIAATNRDLEAAMRAGSFREDLFYRLKGVTIELPPLRDRTEDVPLLATYLLEQAAREDSMPAKKLSPAALRKLVEYRFPGNVRELQNVLRNALLMADGDEIEPDDLLVSSSGSTAISSGDALRAGAGASGASAGSAPRGEVEAVYDRIRGSGISLFDMRKELERGCIARALDEASGNITRAAALLGMKRPRLSQLVREYGLAKGGEPDETPET